MYLIFDRPEETGLPSTGFVASKKENDEQQSTEIITPEPVVPVRWCLEPKEAARLKALRAKNVRVLFVIAYEGTDLEDRQIVPIDDLMTFITFRRPGKHILLAKVLWSNSPKIFGDLMEKTSHRSYAVRVLNLDRTEFKGEHDGYDFLEVGFSFVNTLQGHAEQEVTVSDAHFPKEPPEWLQRLANFGIDWPPVDECAFRRRELWLLPKLPALGLWAIITTLIRAVIALVLGISGVRGIDFAAIIHPWRSRISDVTYYTEDSNTWFSRTSDGKWRSRWTYLLYPWFYIIAGGIFVLVAHRLHMGYWQLFMAMLGGIAGFATTIAKFLAAWFAKFLGRYWLFFVGVAGWLVVVYAVKRGARAIIQTRIDRKESLTFQELKRQKEDEKYDEHASLLVCKTTPSLPVLAELPREHRTLRLRFLNLKRRVCRPYAAR